MAVWRDGVGLAKSDLEIAVQFLTAALLRSETQQVVHTQVGYVPPFTEQYKGSDALKLGR